MPEQTLTGKVVGQNADGKDILALDGGVSVSFSSTTAGNPQIVGLQIDHTKTDDQLLKQLVAIKPLRSLKIENSAVTTEGLQLLKTLPHLRQLCIAQNNSKVSDSNLESLRSQLQNCRVFRDITLYNPHE